MTYFLLKVYECSLYIYELEIFCYFEFFFYIVFNSEEDISGSVESNHSAIAVGLLDMCRKYIDKCLNCERQVLPNSFKLCSSVLDLMTDIAKTIKIDLNDYGVLFQWTQTLATHEYASKKFQLVLNLCMNLIIFLYRRSGIWQVPFKILHIRHME